jgi:superfamily II DNA/RNA helicase
MSQMARNKTIDGMRRGKIRLLVATDVAARGLDVNGISHVINFDLPRFAEDYVHRIGRTGRAGASGIAISFVSSSELSYLEKIERFIGKKLPELNIDGLAPLSILRRVARGNGAKRPSGHGNSRFGGAGSRSNAAPAHGKPRTNSSKPAPARTGRPAARPGSNQPVVEYRTRRAETQSGQNKY